MFHKYTFTTRYILNTNSEQTVISKSFFLRGIICMSVDIVLAFLFTISSYICLVWYFMKPRENGFYCNDVSIRNPLYPNTISTFLLLFVTMGLPFFVILIANFLFKFDLYRDKLLRLAEEFIHSSTHTYLNYVFSFWFLTLLLDVVKCAGIIFLINFKYRVVGRLRPNFIAMCQPGALDICEKDQNAFISTTTCLANWKKARNARMSFPSGHAGASVFALLFIIYFLHRLHATTKNATKTARAFRYVVCFFYGIFTAYCCVSRITDFWHFPTDVLGGTVVAILIFTLCFIKRRGF